MRSWFFFACLSCLLLLKISEINFQTHFSLSSPEAVTKLGTLDRVRKIAAVNARVRKRGRYQAVTVCDRLYMIRGEYVIVCIQYE